VVGVAVFVVSVVSVFVVFVVFVFLSSLMMMLLAVEAGLVVVGAVIGVARMGGGDSGDEAR
jgi:hypothetical protein